MLRFIFRKSFCKTHSFSIFITKLLYTIFTSTRLDTKIESLFEETTKLGTGDLALKFLLIKDLSFYFYFFGYKLTFLGAKCLIYLFKKSIILSIEIFLI